MSQIECVNCGNSEFSKMSSTSCNEIPPIFVCAKCNKCQPMKINRKLDPRYNTVYSSKNERFTSYPKCYVCGSIESSDWIVKEVELKDDLNNPIFRKYAYCSRHKP